MNTSLNKNLDTVVLKDYFNIGVAVDTPEGLIVQISKMLIKRLY